MLIRAPTDFDHRVKDPTREASTSIGLPLVSVPLPDERICARYPPRSSLPAPPRARPARNASDVGLTRCRSHMWRAMWCCATPAWGEETDAVQRKTGQVNHRACRLFKASWRRISTRSWAPAAFSVVIILVPRRLSWADPVTTAIRCRSNSPQLTRHARGSALHHPGRPGVLASFPPRTGPNYDNPRKSDAFGASDRIRRGVAESGCGVVSRNGSDPSPRGRRLRPEAGRGLRRPA